MGNVWPATVIVDGRGREDKGTVEVPITRPLVPKDTRVPAIVMSGVFGVRVVPAIRTLPSGRTVTGWPAAAMIDDAAEEGTGIVEVPTTRALIARDIGVPAIVMAGAFGVRVVPAIRTLTFGRGFTGCPAAVRGSAATKEDVINVDVPTTRPLLPTETGVPAIVTAGAFGARVVPAIRTLPFGRTVTGYPAAVMTSVVAEAGRTCTTIALAAIVDPTTITEPGLMALIDIPCPPETELAYEGRVGCGGSLAGSWLGGE